MTLELIIFIPVVGVVGHGKMSGIDRIAWVDFADLCIQPAMGLAGFEPETSRYLERQTSCSTKLSYSLKCVDSRYE